MGRYTIYFSTLNDVKNYYEFLDKKKRGIEVNELEQPTPPTDIVFGNKRNKKDKSLKLEKYEIDYLFSYFKDEEAFLKEIAKHPNSAKLTDLNRNRLLVTYTTDNKVKELPIVYNNRLLCLAAYQVKKKKESGLTLKKIKLNNIEELDNYIARIKDYIRDPKDNAYKQLSNKFKFDKNFSGAITSYHSMFQHESSISNSAEINACSRIIDDRLRDYDTLRKIILWENKYKRKEQDPIEEEMKQEELESFTKEEELSYRKLKKKLKDYEGDKIYDFYNDGGPTAVIKNMDIDELNSYPKEVLEDVGIKMDGWSPDGVLPPDGMRR